MTTEAVRYPRYRWVVLGMAWLTLVCVTWSQFLIPSLAYRLIPELGLTHMQFTLIFTGPMLIAIFAAIPGGALGDRYGIRLIVAIAVFLGGVIGLARAFTPSFEGMFALMLLYGIPFGTVLPNLPKLVGIWFPPRETGLASGIYNTALSTGCAFGLLTGPLFGGWKPAFTYIGILMLVAAILWTLFARNTPKGVEIYMPPVVSGIKRGVRSKNIWLVAMGQFLFLGTLMAFSQNLPTALQSVHQVSPGTAGAIASLFTWGMVAGHLFFPTLSDRVGLRKPFIYVSAVIAAVCLFFAWYLAPGAATWILVFLGGFTFGAVPPILWVFPVELPEIGHEYVGGASGLVASLQNVGVLIPLLVISPLVAAGTLGAYTTGFLVIALLLAAIALPALLVMETGVRAKRPEA